MVKKIAASKDTESRVVMLALLENKQVHALIGPGADRLVDALK
jgi:hypothetical protein